MIHYHGAGIGSPTALFETMRGGHVQTLDFHVRVPDEWTSVKIIDELNKDAGLVLDDLMASRDLYDWEENTFLQVAQLYKAELIDADQPDLILHNEGE